MPYDIKTLYDEQGNYIGYKEPDTDIRLVDVKPVSGLNNKLMLYIKFANGAYRIYDVGNMFDNYPQFKILDSDHDLFDNVKFNDYCVYWNDELDISEAELWYNGEDIMERASEER